MFAKLRAQLQTRGVFPFDVVSADAPDEPAATLLPTSVTTPLVTPVPTVVPPPVPAVSLPSDEKVVGLDGDGMEEFQPHRRGNLTLVYGYGDNKQRVTWPRAAAFLSKLLKEACSKDDECQEITILDLTPRMSELVTEYVLHFQDPTTAVPFAGQVIPKPLPNDGIDMFLTPFEQQFRDKCSVQDLMQLAMAANYLDIPPLFEFANVSLASLVINKTSAEISARFGMAAEWTEAEFERAKSQYPTFFASEPRH